MRRWFALFLLLLASCGTADAGTYFTPAAAVVNGAKIPEADLAEGLRQALLTPQGRAQLEGPLNADNRLTAQREILSQLIKEELVIQEARRMDLNVDRQVVQRIEAIRSRYPSNAEFEKAAAREGFTMTRLRELIRREILTTEIAGRLTGERKPAPEDVQKAYEQNKAGFDAQIKASHILVCANFDEATRTCNLGPEDEQRANDLAARARAGEDFAKLAGEFSIDTSSRVEGGDLGYFTKGTMASEFEEAAFALAAGEVSAPVKTQFGYHIIKVTARGRTLDESRAQIEEQLTSEQAETAFRDFLTKALTEAKVRINPKFGRFDRSSFQVVPLPTQVRPAPEVPQLPGFPGVGSEEPDGRPTQPSRTSPQP